MAMQAIAGSSTAMNAVIKSTIARASIKTSPYLPSLVSVTYSTCNSDTQKFGKYELYVGVSQDYQYRYWTPTSGVVSSQPSPDSCIVFCYMVYNTSTSDNTLNIYHLDDPNTVVESISTNAGEQKALSPYRLLLEGIKAYDTVGDRSAFKEYIHLRI